MLYEKIRDFSNIHEDPFVYKNQQKSTLMGTFFLWRRIHEPELSNWEECICKIKKSADMQDALLQKMTEKGIGMWKTIGAIYESGNCILFYYSIRVDDSTLIQGISRLQL